MARPAKRPEIELPATLGPISLRGSVDLALRLIAFDLWRLVEPHLSSEWGETWARDLAERSDFPVCREDASTMVSLLLTQNAVVREAVRDALDRARWKAMYDNKSFLDIRRIRNEFAHPDGSGEAVLWAENSLSRLAKAARVGGLEAFEDIQRLTAALIALKQGGSKLPTREESKAAQAQLAEAQAQIRAVEARAAEAEARVEASRDLQAHAEAQLHEARAQIDRLAASNSTADEEHDRLEAALSKAKAAERAAAAEIARREEALARVEHERLEMAHRLEAAERELLTNQAIAQEALTSAPTSASRAQPAAVQSLDEGELARLVEELSATVDLITAQAAAHQLPAPGGLWTFPRGDEVWRLSKVHRSLTRAEDEIDLKSLVGATRANEIVTAFLEIRPTGGRVWVDTDGDAVTYADGRLVYLGRMNGQSELTDASLQPGDALPEISGRGYSLSPSGRIECRATGETLDAAVGKNVAQDVAARILPLKPKGGRLKVSSDGIVAGFVDRQWVYLTRVQASEWFPEHLG